MDRDTSDFWSWIFVGVAAARRSRGSAISEGRGRRSGNVDIRDREKGEYWQLSRFYWHGNAGLYLVDNEPSEWDRNGSALPGRANRPEGRSLN